jgi:hypothetical protein
LIKYLPALDYANYLLSLEIIPFTLWIIFF